MCGYVVALYKPESLCVPNWMIKSLVQHWDRKIKETDLAWFNLVHTDATNLCLYICYIY